ncbi:MAG: hypothetical protein Q9203_006951, partial [Teloschistes exilis]
MPIRDQWILPRYHTMADPVAEPRISTVGAGHTEIEYANIELATVRQTLDKLRKWHDWGVRSHQSLRWYLWSRIYHKRPPCPSRDQLKQLALFFFPPRATAVKVEICDYGDGRFKRYDTTVDDLVPCRHAPVGLGLVSFNIRQSFIRAGIDTDRPAAWYEHAGPDLSCEATSLRDRQYLQDQLDVFNILRDFGSLMNEFDVRSRSSKAPTMQSDLREELKLTADNYDVGTSYWHQTITDIPWQLGEGTRTSLLDTDLGVNPASTLVQEQFLSRHPSYENAVLVRSLFQCYHREGFVLTLSPLAGVGMVDKRTLQEMQSRPGTRAARDDTSFLGSFMDKYAASGTAGWPTKSTLWFVVMLLTELLATPRKNSSGIPVPSMQRAYIPTIRDLIEQKSRQTANFKRNESVNLVRDYISCLDELSQIQGVAKRKIDFLDRLRWDIASNPMNKNSRNLPNLTDLSNERVLASADANNMQITTKLIEDAIAYIQKEHAELPEMMEDLKSSLHDLFQLRTIEQNELAIIAESNNQAILVFTVVTIVFLPLSFFSSYFGMNFTNTSAILKDQGYFWGVCGTVTLVIVAFTLIYGFKRQIEPLLTLRASSQNPAGTFIIDSSGKTRTAYQEFQGVFKDRSMPQTPQKDLRTLSHHLVAFEHVPSSSSSPEPRPQPQNSLLFIAGLGDGLLTTPYTPTLAAALPPTWSLIQVLLSSSYSGWGTSSLTQDIAEISQCVTYFQSRRPQGKIILMGNSTGCQDVLGYLSFPPTPDEERAGQGGERPRVDGGILQAPVSDREAIEMIYPRDDLERYNKLAQRFVSDGKADEMLPNEVSLPFLGARTTASRWLSLSSPAPLHNGQDDLFSSDLPASRFADTFGVAGRRGAKLLILYSGDDAFVPKSVDKEAL